MGFSRRLAGDPMTAQSQIIGLLATRPGQPRRAMYQYGLPHSHKWGYSPGPRQAIEFFDAEDVEQLYIKGILQFTDDEHGARCAVLARPYASEPPADANVIRFEQPAVRPLRFEQLLQRRGAEPDVDLVFHVHVPKASGRTVAALLRQNDFLTLDFDMNSGNFFDIVPETTFLGNYGAPPPRRAYALTGHFRLDHPMLRRAWTPHVIITTLRHPIERMLSYYNHTLRVAGNPWHADVAAGMAFIEYAQRALAAFGPQYSFFDDTGRGSFAPSGHATVEECLHNLVTRVGIFGLTEHFDEFAVLIGYLLNRPGIAIATRNVTSEIPSPTDLPAKLELSKRERDELGELLKHDVWFYEEAVKEYERRVSNPAIQRVLSEALPLVQTSRSNADRLSALRDPSHPERRAFGFL
jgi:hypothetical protein